MELIANSMEDEFEFEFADLPDPFACTVEISASCSVADVARRALSPLLEGIDPTFQLINITGSTEANSRLIDSNKYSTPAFISPVSNGLYTESRRGESGEKLGNTIKSLETPALAVMFFLRDCGPLSYETLSHHFLKEPWKFHHKIEISSARRGTVRCLGKQEFYEIEGASAELPLWSVCPVHIGNEHIRFTVFTKNFGAMLDFYRLLCASEVENSKPGFCLFELYSQPGFGVQLALKYSAQLNPRPLKCSLLKMKIKSVNSVWSCLQSKPMQCGLGEYLIQDPDGNNIVVEETGNIDQYTWKDAVELPACDSSLDDVSDSLDSGRCSSFSGSTNNDIDTFRYCKDAEQLTHIFCNQNTESDISCPSTETKSTLKTSQFQTSNRVECDRDMRASTRSSRSERLKNITAVRF